MICKTFLVDDIKVSDCMELQIDWILIENWQKYFDWIVLQILSLLLINMALVQHLW